MHRGQSMFGGPTGTESHHCWHSGAEEGRRRQCPPNLCSRAERLRSTRCAVWLLSEMHARRPQAVPACIMPAIGGMPPASCAVLSMEEINAGTSSDRLAPVGSLYRKLPQLRPCPQQPASFHAGACCMTPGLLESVVHSKAGH